MTNRKKLYIPKDNVDPNEVFKQGLPPVRGLDLDCPINSIEEQYRRTKTEEQELNEAHYD